MITIKDLDFIVDDREKALYPHLEVEATEINVKKQRITTGDYALICTKTNQLLAVFERKSLTDFGASLKDGRYLNKQSLLDIRAITGCRIIYIIEGPAHPNSSMTFARVPFAAIESSIFHMMVRDNIIMMYTLNTQHTISKLVSFIKSMVTLLNSNS